MPCQDCKREGKATTPQIVVGWKVWYANGVKVSGKTFESWKILPDDGVLLVMLYYDRFCTQGLTRYRRILHGNDYYFCAPGTQDFIYGHGDEAPEETANRYPQASIKRGIWTDDAHYKAIVTAAMEDFGVSEIGIPIEPETHDT